MSTGMLSYIVVHRFWDATQWMTIDFTCIYACHLYTWCFSDGFDFIVSVQIIGLYVGVATVGVFIIWFTHGSFLGIDLSGDGHTLVTYSQLSNWGQCPSWEGFTVSPFKAGSHVFAFNHPCDYFQAGKVKAMTLSLSVLVAIEMFNSLNALSEDGSLLSMPPWVNPWLLVAMSVSFGLHFLILYVPFLAQVFGIVPLSLNEWLLVLAVAFPVILIDEVLKFVGRWTSRSYMSGSKLSPKHKDAWGGCEILKSFAGNDSWGWVDSKTFSGASRIVLWAVLVAPPIPQFFSVLRGWVWD